MFGYPDTLDPIDLAAPFAEHPLNEGRIAWWLGLPPLDGGGQLYDLVSGRLTATTSGGCGWIPTGRGDAAVNLNGTTGCLIPNASSSSILSYTTGFSLGCWFRLNALSNYTNGIAGLIGKYQNSNGWTLRVQSQTGLTFGGTTTISSATGLLSIGPWNRAVATCYGSIGTIYLNGAVVASGSVVQGAVSDPVIIGRDYTTAPRYLAGAIGDISFWSRPLSPGEVLADYDLSQRGYPSVLRRYRSFATLKGAAPAPSGSGSRKKFSINERLGVGINLR